jgi:hypothetical protein
LRTRNADLNAIAQQSANAAMAGIATDLADLAEAINRDESTEINMQVVRGQPVRPTGASQSVASTTIRTGTFAAGGRSFKPTSQRNRGFQYTTIDIDPEEATDPSSYPEPNIARENIQEPKGLTQHFHFDANGQGVHALIKRHSDPSRDLATLILDQDWVEPGDKPGTESVGGRKGRGFNKGNKGPRAKSAGPSVNKQSPNALSPDDVRKINEDLKCLDKFNVGETKCLDQFKKVATLGQLGGIYQTLKSSGELDLLTSWVTAITRIREQKAEANVKKSAEAQAGIRTFAEAAKQNVNPDPFGILGIKAKPADKFKQPVNTSPFWLPGASEPGPHEAKDLILDLTLSSKHVPDNSEYKDHRLAYDLLTVRDIVRMDTIESGMSHISHFEPQELRARRLAHTFMITESPFDKKTCVELSPFAYVNDDSELALGTVVNVTSMYVVKKIYSGQTYCTKMGFSEDQLQTFKVNSPYGSNILNIPEDKCIPGNVLNAALSMHPADGDKLIEIASDMTANAGANFSNIPVPSNVNDVHDFLKKTPIRVQRAMLAELKKREMEGGLKTAAVSRLQSGSATPANYEDVEQLRSSIKGAGIGQRPATPKE